MPSRRFETWGRTFAFEPAVRAEPATEEDVRAVVVDAVRAGRKIRVVGAGHSWSDLVVTDGVLVSLDRLDRVLHVDGQQGRVTVEAGIRLKALNERLAEVGLALPILGSIAEQSVAGVISTGTHGSSLVHGNLSTLVTAVRLVTSSGDVLDVDEADPRFPGVVLSLGAVGVLVRVTLKVVPAFRLAEEVEPVAWDAAVERAVAVARAEEYAKIWWLPHTERAVVFRYRRTDEPPTFSPRARWFDEAVVNRWAFWALLRLGALLPALIPTLNALVGAIYFRRRRTVGRSDQMLNLAMPPVHRETEWAFPVERTADVLRALRRRIDDEGLRVDFILEVRFVRGDDLWMSPANGGDVCQLGAYVANPAACDAYFGALAEIVAEHGGRPHWGKECRFTPDEIAARFPRVGDFRRLVDELDPHGTFRNAYVDRVLGPGADGGRRTALGRQPTADSR